MTKKLPNFKTYHQNQLSLLPTNLSDLILENHPVRIVNQVIDQLDIKLLIAEYNNLGCSSYHPRMMLKVLIYAYLKNIYSSRKIAEALRENIHFMWLSANALPDHNTINRFRGKRLSKVIKTLFSQVVILLAEEGLVSLEKIYIDGTKLEANANKYTFVWGKRIKNSREKIKQQLEELWKYAKQVTDKETDDLTEQDFDPVDPEKIQATINKLNEMLAGNDKVDDKVKKKLKYAEKNWPSNIEKYNQQEEILAGRNSYSKTDPDATFMRMKDDHMKNGQLKAAYNWQIGTEDQFILNYEIGQSAGDTTTLIGQVENFKQLYPEYNLKELCADAGYGSEENYNFLNENNIDGYVKFNYFHKEQKKSWQEKKPFSKEKLHYNIAKNEYICPIGQAMKSIGKFKRKTKTGYEQTIEKYQAQNCNNCPLRSLCHQSKTNRIIQFNYRLEKYKQQARANLKSEKGLAHRSKRPCDVEAVFGNIKQNKKFTRFMLRGLQKVKVEAGLIAIAHNLKKKAA